MNIDTSIECMPFQQIPLKSHDASPIDCCAFGLLKRLLSKCKPTTIDGFWKFMEEKYKSIRLEILLLKKCPSIVEITLQICRPSSKVCPQKLHQCDLLKFCMISCNRILGRTITRILRKIEWQLPYRHSAPNAECQ